MKEHGQAELMQPVMSKGNNSPNSSPRSRRNLSESNMLIVEPPPEGMSPRTRRNLSEVGTSSRAFGFATTRTSSQPPKTKNPWFRSLIRSKEVDAPEPQISLPLNLLRPAGSGSLLVEPAQLSPPQSPDGSTVIEVLPRKTPPPLPVGYRSPSAAKEEPLSSDKVLSPASGAPELPTTPARSPPPLPRTRISQAEKPRDLDGVPGPEISEPSRVQRVSIGRKEDGATSPGVTSPIIPQSDTTTLETPLRPARNRISLEITTTTLVSEGIITDACSPPSKFSLKERLSETPSVRPTPPARSRVSSEIGAGTILEKKDDTLCSDTPKSPTIGLRGPPPSRSRVSSETPAVTVLDKDEAVEVLAKVSLKSERSAPPPSRSRVSSETVMTTTLSEKKDDLSKTETVEDGSRSPSSRKEAMENNVDVSSTANIPRPPTTARGERREESTSVEATPPVFTPRPPSGRNPNDTPGGRAHSESITGKRDELTIDLPSPSPRPPLSARGEKKEDSISPSASSTEPVPLVRMTSPDLSNLVSLPPPRLAAKAATSNGKEKEKKEGTPPSSTRAIHMAPPRAISPPSRSSTMRHPKGKTSFSRDDLPSIAQLFAQPSFRYTQSLQIEQLVEDIFEEPGNEKEDVKESVPLTNKHGVTVLTGKALKMLGVSVPSGKLPSYCKYGRHGLQEATLTVAKAKLQNVKGQAPALVHYSAKSTNLFREYDFAGEEHHILTLFRQGLFGRTGGCASALLLCSDDQFSKLIPVIGCAIAETPGYAEQVAFALVETVKKRVTQSQVASTAVHFLKMSRLLNYDWAFNDWLESIETESYLFDMLSLLATKEAGFSVSVAASREALHPFQSGFLISGFSVSKVFNSNARPRLIIPFGKQEGENEVKTGSPIIIKQGDDLRQDVACLHMMCLMNSLWEDAGLTHEEMSVKSLAYGCLAVTPNMGCIQFIPNSVPLKMVKDAGRYSSSAITRMITTGAGSFVAAYILGVRDRHHDNILVSKSDGSLFHIDFGHILGDETTIDTGAFAVTPDLKEVMTSLDTNAWELFVSLCVTAYKIIRDHSRLIISFASMLMAPFQSQESVRRFIADRLKLNLDEIAALAKLRDKVQSAPTRLKTKFKNVVHGIATGD